MVSSGSPERSSGSADRALAVLRELSRHTRPVPATVLARQCRIPRSSLHRLLSGLSVAGFVEHGGRGHGWALGPEARRLGGAAPSVQEAVAVLDAFDREQPQLATEEVARRAGLGHERTARTLDALYAEELIARDPGGWSLAARLSGLAARIEPLEQLRRVARPALMALRDETGETANLLVREGERAVYIDQVLSLHALRFAGWAGRSIPLAGTAAGAALIGAAPQPSVATDSVEPGVTAVACRIEPTDDVPAAVSVIAPNARLQREAVEKARDAVRRAATRVRAALEVLDG